MIYGLGTRACIEDGPQVQLEGAVAMGTADRPWSALDRERRLALVHRAMQAGNDLIDAHPIAL
jgi:hypothetical protein